MNDSEKQRIMLGHPSCPKVMTEIPAQLAELGNQRPVGLILPPVQPGSANILEKILELLMEFQDIEITANDWGTLVRTGEWKRTNKGQTKLIMGLLLSGQESDPAIRYFIERQEDRILRIGGKAVLFQWEPPPEELRNHWSEPAAFHMTDMLRRIGVDEIELGLQPVPVSENGRHLPVRQFPYGLMSVRPCCADCEKCGGGEIKRAGCRVFFDRNLLIWENCPSD